MKETRTATPNYGFNQIDSIQDESMLFKEYIEKDSKENWQKADTVIKNIEDKVDNKINLNGKYYDSLNFISDGNSTITQINIGGGMYTLQGGRGEKGEKGEPGTASVAIDDTVENSQKTWSSEKIKNEILGGCSFSVVKRKIVKE